MAAEQTTEQAHRLLAVQEQGGSACVRAFLNASSRPGRRSSQPAGRQAGWLLAVAGLSAAK